jgi:hypothetical protein
VGDGVEFGIFGFEGKLLITKTAFHEIPETRNQPPKKIQDNPKSRGISVTLQIPIPRNCPKKQIFYE